MSELEVSVVMPCLNEEETLGICIKKALDAFKKNNIKGEVIVADNGSTDNSVKIAQSLGARVVLQPNKGYGNAYLKGFEEAKGKFIVMGDSDDSYDFNDLIRFIEPLRAGNDMVMGTRLKGKIMPGAMPWHHRYIGNPFLSWFLNVLFKTGISDAHCGMRSFSKEAFKKLHLQTTGMEFASEMVINASLAGLKIKEIPITLYKDGRNRKPHLRSFRDGWRHLRFMLIYSPTHLFIIPGFIITGLGLLIMLMLVLTPINVLGHELRTFPIFAGSVLSLLGYQIIFLGLFAKIYSYTEKFEKKDVFVPKFTKIFNLEKGIMIGVSMLLIGLIVLAFVIYNLIKSNFDYMGNIRIAIIGSTLMILGIQTIFSSFLLSLMGIERKNNFF